MNFKKAKIGDQIVVINGRKNEVYNNGDTFTIIAINNSRRRRSFLDISPMYGITMVRNNSTDKTSYRISFENSRGTFDLIKLV